MDTTTTTNGRLFFDGSCHGNMLFLGNSDPIFRVPRSLLNMAVAEETSKRRPFFSITDELIDDDFYDEQLPEKKRRLTAEQVHLLEKSFEAENKLEPERKTQLAKKLGLQPRQVAVWFQNRRARWKTKQLERDYDLLKASYDSLLSDYNAVVNDNEKLKSEVVSLTEKLQVKEEILGGVMVMVGQQKSEPLLPAITTDDANIASIHFNVKVEDRLSTGSGGSAVLDDQDCLQLVDSGDSYFPNDGYGGCMGPIDGSFQSEGDDGSDDNRSYFSDVFATTTDQQHEETHQQMGWWVWS